MLLEKLHLLKTQVPKRLQKYVAALEMFNLVRISCFGQELIPGYEKHIVNFKKAYEKLQRQEQIERRMLGYESEDKPYSS